MIVNLLSNAVKFTPEYSSIGLEVHGDRAANKVVITVWDTGIGIREEDLERLFKPFVQLDSGLAREATGTGLGLALVAQMARLHGGSVHALSSPGEGSRFIIQLPWEPAMASDMVAHLRSTGKFRAIDPDFRVAAELSGELQVVFFLHPIAVEMGIVRHLAKLLQHLRSIAPRPAVDPVGLLPAALLTILIKNSFRGKEIVNGSYRIIEPDELLSRLNQELTGSGLSHCQFITGVHAIYDRTDNRVRWARGGAPYPTLLRPGERPRQIQSVGGLMGALDEQTFETVHHDLQPGDIMLFYTDGLENLLLGRQVCGSEGAILQSPWLDQLAEHGPEIALEEIRERVSRLKPTDWPQDDITAIAIELT
jgi:hypothetical protein